MMTIVTIILSWVGLRIHTDRTRETLFIQIEIAMIFQYRVKKPSGKIDFGRFEIRYFSEFTLRPAARRSNK